MSDENVTDAERTKAQGMRLRQLRERLGVSKARVMDAVGLTTTNGYDLYERGTSAIRLNQVAAFATGLDITEQQFIDEVLHEPDDFDFRAELMALVPEAPRWVEDQIREHGDKSVAVQRVLVDFTRDLIAAGFFEVPARFRDDRPDEPEWAEPDSIGALA